MKNDDKVRARATVQVTVEVDGAGGCWGGDCSIAQLHKQAREGAINELRNAFKDLRNLRIVGEPVVTGVLTNQVIS